MNRNSIIYFFGVLIVLLIGACKKDAPAEVDVGYGYIPDEIGGWIIYDVDSVEYNLFQQKVYNYSYQIKEIVESVYFDAQNRETMRIERYKRDSTTGPWLIKDVWAANKLDTRYEKVEENLRFVKLVFPVKNGLIWNGNSANVKKSWDYEYSGTGLSKTINGSSFTYSVTVTQKVYDDGLDKYEFLEIYAKDVGMIYKKAVRLSKSNVQALWNDSTEVNGYDLTMRVNSYGN
ncbi:MAG: hypothetical protein COB85_09365 [Bacteroidetes bacterium]|nr:MAG: hypothetical protein COB85_09365 [Bacteroidota bacterium]